MWLLMPIICTDREIAPPLKFTLQSSPISENFGRSLDFCFWAVRCAPALKFIPTPGRFIVLALDCVRVNVRRRTDRGVPQTLRHYRQRHTVGKQMRPMAVAQGVQASALRKR